MLCQSLLYSKVTQLYICILSLFKCFFPLWFITGYSVWFPVLYSRTLFIHSKCDSLHLPNRDSFNISDYRNFSSFILHILSYENEHKIFRFRVKLFPHNIIETHLKCDTLPVLSQISTRVVESVFYSDFPSVHDI